jgi:hypothetical protein
MCVFVARDLVPDQRAQSACVALFGIEQVVRGLPDDAGRPRQKERFFVRSGRNATRVGSIAEQRVRGLLIGTAVLVPFRGHWSRLKFEWSI